MTSPQWVRELSSRDAESWQHCERQSKSILVEKEECGLEKKELRVWPQGKRNLVKSMLGALTISNIVGMGYPMMVKRSQMESGRALSSRAYPSQTIRILYESKVSHLGGSVIERVSGSQKHGAVTPFTS
ncbi:hypothetical protein HZH68_006044 [Vespula germanica]|uniref:Uncharacterized protein n=1 Tax=Vespula germanica TaxID=30212 RepID=A0A834NBV4_VESGE|nr:hypothetical protein HZH68_006044 [Vespula germanica]